MPFDFFQQPNNFSIFLTEDKWFYLTCMLTFSLLFVLWIAYIRFQSNRRVNNLKKELNQLEKEVETFRDRSRSNLEIFRKVIDGFEDILSNMRRSIDEEEAKLNALSVHSKTAHEETSLTENTQK